MKQRPGLLLVTSCERKASRWTLKYAAEWWLPWVFCSRDIMGYNIKEEKEQSPQTDDY